MSSALMQTLVDEVLERDADQSQARDSVFQQSERSAKLLAQFLQQLRRQSGRQLDITKKRQGQALFFYTNLMLPAGAKGSLRYSLYFAAQGNELYSNLRNPAVHSDWLLQSASSRSPENKLVGLSQVQLFGLIRQLAVKQGLLAGENTNPDEPNYKLAVANARPVLAALRSLRQQSDGQFSFSLTRVHNALCVRTNLTVELPYDDQGGATHPVALTVEPTTMEAHYLQQARGLKGPEPTTATEFLSEVAKLAVARRWIQAKPKP